MAAANTSVAREYHAGLAAMLGVQAALAAQRGYKAEESILETRRGFFEVYGGQTARAWSESWRSWDIITDMAIKLAPAAIPTTLSPRLPANAAREADILPEAVESITVSRPSFTALNRATAPDRSDRMAHSPAYFLAAGAADRDFSWIHATPRIGDPVIDQLIDKIRVGSHHRQRLALPQGATVTIRTTDGRTSTSTVLSQRERQPAGLPGTMSMQIPDPSASGGVLGRQIETSLAVIHDFS